MKNSELSFDDIEFIRDIGQIAKYLNWENDSGRRLAKEIIDFINSGRYGKGDIWAQFDNLIMRLEDLRDEKE